MTKTTMYKVTHLVLYNIVVVIISILIHKLHIFCTYYYDTFSYAIWWWEMVVCEQEDKSLSGYEYLFFSRVFERCQKGLE